MSSNVFARVETKFMLTKGQADQIQAALRQRGFGEDQYGLTLIQSLYFDTSDFLLIRRSLDRPNYKEKLRLRCYGSVADTSPAFLEIKKKYDGVVYKRRIEMDYHTAYQTANIPENAGQIGREISWMIQRYELSPQMLILYERAAWRHPEKSSLRFTFDQNIRWRNQSLNLTGKPAGNPLTNQDQVLMEIKVPGAYPLWLLKILSNCGAKRTHFSKYGAAYKELCAAMQNNEEEKRIRA